MTEREEFEKWFENQPCRSSIKPACWLAWQARAHRPAPEVKDVEVSNLLHLMNLDRPDIASLPNGSIISCNITTHRMAADLIKRLATRPAPEVGSELSDAPCDKCGYNGVGYYQSATHPCAAKPTSESASEERCKHGVWTAD